jgi:hypothetical protein
MKLKKNSVLLHAKPQGQQNKPASIKIVPAVFAAF